MATPTIAGLYARAPEWLRHAGFITAIGAGIALVAGLVHATGGGDGPYTYVMVLPLLLAAGLYGLLGGTVTGAVGGLSLGPIMPADAAGGLAQSPEEWLVRVAAFVLVGLVAGAGTDRLRRSASAERAALRRDPPTGLPNQVAFREDLGSRLDMPEGGKREIAAVLVRATDLEDIVDVTGIAGGDQVMRELGEHVCRVCPEVRQAYRFAAAELALLVEFDNRQGLQRLARTLHDVAGTSLVVDGAPVRVEPALGIGHTGADATGRADELVRRARVALRRAVELDRDWVSYEPSLETDDGASVALIARAGEALEAGEFELHYQPKIHLADGRPAGAEALVRWRQPETGIVPPGSFMPKLERTSLIDAFSRFIVRTATDFARSGVLVPVSVNLAPRNLADDALVNALIEGLRQTGTPPAHLEVEITESALMRDPERAIVLLHRLREHGVGVSIDDFGTGYASFAYLRQLPATDLKIDRAFVRPLEGEPRTARLVLAMIEAGHALDLTVTAEGVETAEQARILTDLGCDSGQGFLWSPARPQAELRQWLAAHPDRPDPSPH